MNKDYALNVLRQLPAARAEESLTHSTWSKGGGWYEAGVPWPVAAAFGCKPDMIGSADGLTDGIGLETLNAGFFATVANVFDHPRYASSLTKCTDEDIRAALTEASGK